MFPRKCAIPLSSMLTSDAMNRFGFGKSMASKRINIKRITISVPHATAARIKKAAGDMPVSAWVTGLVEDRLQNAELEELWRKFYESVRPGRRDIRRADRMFDRLTQKRSRETA